MFMAVLNWNTKLTSGLPIGLPLLLCLRKVNTTLSPVIVGDEDVPVPVVPDSLTISVLTERLPRAVSPVGVPRLNVSVWVGPGLDKLAGDLQGGLSDLERERTGRDAAEGYAKG